MKYFLEKIFHNNNYNEKLKVQSIRLIIIPLLLSIFRKKEEKYILTKNLSQHIVEYVLCATQPIGVNQYGDAMKIELLKIATLLIKHMPVTYLNHRKELIKFAWNHLKCEDVTIKHYAYVNVCRFIAEYETPPKIILQVYVALLRSHQAESRHLVEAALNILVPSLPLRLVGDEFIKAVKWTKKVIYEEGHSLQQLIHIWKVIVNHPQLFYDQRSHFIPQMVNSLNRLGLPPNCAVKNRELAMNMAELIVTWERHPKN
jgi:transformation/transcription domain-associated protein